MGSNQENEETFFYCLGHLIPKLYSQQNKNYLILMSVLNCLFDSMASVLRKNVEKKGLLENLDLALLIMDEICDGGVVMETEPSAVLSRVALRSEDVAYGEHSVAQVGMQVLQSAKDQLKWSILK